MNLNKVFDNIDARIDSHLPQTAEAIKRRKNRILRPIAAISLAAAAVVGGNIVHNLNEAPTFSSETDQYVLEAGEGIWDAAEHIENVNTIDNMQDAVAYVQSMPENADALEDGLQFHEALTIPVSVETESK